MKSVRSHLGIKLFISYFVVILVGMAVLWVTTKAVTPAAFARHLSYMESQINGSGGGMGRGQGAGMMAEFYTNFQATFNESLVIALLAATLAALVVSYLFSRRILQPVNVMMEASQRIAAGRFDERVSIQGTDELSQLADRFNQMAEKLEQVETMRRQLIGAVAHELRTPLTSIKGYAEGLMDGVLPPTVETYDQIHTESERLNRLVDDLQELSRVESKAIQLDMREIEAVAPVQIVLKRMRPAFEKKGVSLLAELPEAPLSILADEDRLVQVMTNLIGNALQYTPEKGTVSVTVTAMDGEVKFTVRDTGVGIPPEHLDRIFDRFYRVDKSRSRLMGGSGIGLTIARHLIESHHGQLRAESGGAGQGSLFTFTLPQVRKN